MVTAFVIVLLLGGTAWGQSKDKDKGKAKAATGQTVTPPAGIDREKFKNEALNLEKEAMKLPDGPEAGLFKKHHYCITCQNGQRHTCVMPVGGEGGRVMCSGKCMAVCGGGCNIAYGGC
jgi:hypothetical protein